MREKSSQRDNEFLASPGMQLLESGEQVGKVARPVEARERLELLDVARGFAIFGILLVNFSSMKSAAWYGRFLSSGTEDISTSDQIADWAIYFLAEGKFITILSLLFGLGFGMLMEKAEQTGDRFLLSRRFVFLLGLGLVHGLFIWHGDILTFYAIGGFILLLFRKCSPRTLCIWAAALYIAGAVLYLAVMMAVFLGADALGDPGMIDRWLLEMKAAAEQAYGSGTFMEIMWQRAIDFLINGVFAFLWMPATISCFALGLAAWKAGVPAGLDQLQPAARRLFCWALPIAVFAPAFSMAYGAGVFEQTLFLWGVSMLVHFLGPPAMAAVYLALLVLIWGHPIGRLLFHPLAPVGRMALTNYLL
ncbi:MAG: DUF418 domain-containing protein, partial [Verrucomicrobiaceae bacterium]